MKTMELCVPCAEKMKEGYRLQVVKSGANQKVDCAACRRRRFGSTYQVEKKKKEE